MIHLIGVVRASLISWHCCSFWTQKEAHRPAGPVFWYYHKNLAAQGRGRARETIAKMTTTHPVQLAHPVGMVLNESDCIRITSRDSSSFKCQRHRMHHEDITSKGRWVARSYLFIGRGILGLIRELLVHAQSVCIMVT